MHAWGEGFMKMSNRPAVAAAVFVKTPGYSPLKTRLAEGIGTENAEQFHRRATRCVRDVLRESIRILSQRGIELQPIWAVAEPEALGDPVWNDFPVMGQGGGELGSRLHRVYAQLIDESEGVLLLGADSPQLDVELIVSAVREVIGEKPRFCLAPANDGGFSLFGGNAPILESVWTSVPYSSQETARCLIEQLEPFGPVERLSELIDVDTLDDLIQILPVLNRENALSSQRELGQWIVDKTRR